MEAIGRLRLKIGGKRGGGVLEKGRGMRQQTSMIKNLQSSVRRFSRGRRADNLKRLGKSGCNCGGSGGRKWGEIIYALG